MTLRLCQASKLVGSGGAKLCRNCEPKAWYGILEVDEVVEGSNPCRAMFMAHRRIGRGSNGRKWLSIR